MGTSVTLGMDRVLRVYRVVGIAIYTPERFGRSVCLMVLVAGGGQFAHPMARQSCGLSLYLPRAGRCKLEAEAAIVMPDARRSMMIR